VYISVYITAADADEAERIAMALVEERLAACVNFFPCRSVYRWTGSLEQSGEYVLLCKTRQALLARLQERVKAIHSYEVPAIVAFRIPGGDPDYLKWIEEETSDE